MEAKYNSYLDGKYPFKYVNVAVERAHLSKLAIKLKREKAALELMKDVYGLSEKARKAVDATAKEVEKTIRNYNRVRTTFLDCTDVVDRKIAEDEFPEGFEVIGEVLLTE